LPTTPAPIRLTDSELTEMMRLAAPLQPVARDGLLRILAHELRGRAEVGDGELFRLAREIIKSYKLYDPPLRVRSAPPLLGKFCLQERNEFSYTISPF
jgi:hypothetical protein